MVVAGPIQCQFGGRRRPSAADGAQAGHAHEGGVRLAAGTDTPNPFIGPGSSLHHELQLLVRCGMTPIAAIHAATGAAADLIGSREVGVVEPGRLADLVLVRGTPADDVSALRGIEAVMIGGRFVTRPSA